MAAKKKAVKKARVDSSKKVEAKTVLVLRSVDKDGLAHGGFKWPEKGEVEAPDWDPNLRCGNGLHGWLRGEGDAGAGSFSWVAEDFATRLWQVVEVAESDIVQLVGKVKFPRGRVILTGTQLEAVQKIQEAYPNAAVIGGKVTVGSYGTATAGDSGTATAGDSGTATAGYRGTATAGYRGTATAGSYGTATAGSYGTATAGSYGTATAGDSGILVLRHFDYSVNRYRLVVGYVGENGIEKGKKYELNDKHELVEAQ